MRYEYRCEECGRKRTGMVEGVCQGCMRKYTGEANMTHGEARKHERQRARNIEVFIRRLEQGYERQGKSIFTPEDGE
jgi:ribosomal protein L37AE/L43A